MKIGLIGYGQMGREIEKIARSRAHDIAFILSRRNRDEFSAAQLNEADVIIEFTRPEAAYENIRECLIAGVPVVSGTTGWTSRLNEIESLCQQQDGALFYASNFSIGVNLFFELNEYLAALLSRYPGYAARIEEIHHTRKKDAPSGTAITLANHIQKQNPGFSGWTFDIPTPEGKIGMTSIREGDVTGTHSVIYLSSEEKISIRHEAFNRSSFASGAVSAAEFLFGRKGVFTMKDLISNNNPG